jgi:PAS domain S-box-containing protein
MYVVEHHIIRKDGSIIMVETKGNARRDSEGNIFEIICNVRDVTERKTLEQDLELKENAIQNSITGIALSGNNGLITYVNKAFLQLWGNETNQEVLGRSVIEFWDNPNDIVEIIESIKFSNSWTGERVAKRKDGSTFHCQISSNFLSDASGNVTHFMGSFWDVTEHKNHELLIANSLKKKSSC